MAISLTADIAVKMLASALRNYRRVQTGDLVSVADFQTYDEMNETERAFYHAALHKAYTAIFRER